MADDQNGTADFLNGVWDPNSLGIPEIAVFTFDEINLQSTANITVVGTRALAFLSHGNATIDTTIDLSGQGVPFPAPAPAGVGRVGGFSGASGNQVPGDGPGGGGGGSFLGGSGGFGGPASSSGPSATIGTPGAAYGDLVSGPLQGGSGGGSSGLTNGNGAAGGGALEISALGSVTLAAGGSLVVSGGGVDPVLLGGFTHAGGAGSGGGIRIQGQSVDLLGSIDASGASSDNTSAASNGGGGRVAVFGLNQLFDFIVGVTNPSSINTSMINVEGGPFTSGGANTQGLISVSPQVTSVPSGQSLTLGEVTDLSDANRRLELLHHNIRVQQGGEAVVPADGYVNSGKIELFPGGSTVSGPGTLDNRGELSGTGTVEVPVVNDPGGTIDAINDVLTFTQSVDNGAGGQISAINSTLDFQAGLTNDGQLNLINSTILGSITGSASGAASFVGDNSVGGNLAMAAGDSLAIRLGGTMPAQFDDLAVGGDALFAGSLGVSLTGGFTLAPSQSFTIVDVGGTASGNFAGLGEGALVGSFGSTDLFITYAGGDGNDVSLFTTVPVLPGDYNGNGTVDAADYVVWRNLEGQMVTLPNENTAAMTPGVVDDEDYDFWAANFGNTAGAGSMLKVADSSHAVPERTTMLLATIMAVILSPTVYRRRRVDSSGPILKSSPGRRLDLRLFQNPVTSKVGEEAI